MGRWLTGAAAGICAAIALLAMAYGLNALNDWHEHREVVRGHLAAMEADPGYPNRDSSIRSEREQLEILDRTLARSGLVSVAVVALALAGFVPLWQRAARSFGTLRLAILAALAAALLIAALALAMVLLSAGAIRG